MGNTQGMRSSTIWTTAWDLTELVLYYHTQHNRRVRALYITDVDFSQLGKGICHLPSINTVSRISRKCWRHISPAPGMLPDTT